MMMNTMAPVINVALLLGAFMLPVAVLGFRKRYLVLASRIAGGIGFLAIFLGAIFFAASYGAAMALH